MLVPDTSQHAASVTIVSGNDPLPLDGRDVWSVATGSAGIFQSAADDGVPARPRCLLTVSSGETILWMPGDGVAGSITLVPFERSEVWRRPMAEHIAAVVRGDQGAVRDLQRWTELLQAAIRSAGGEVARIAWDGALTGEDVTRQLESLQTTFLHTIHETHQQRDEARRRRFQQRQLLNDRVAERTAAELASGHQSKPPREEGAWSESPLLTAARLVAETQEFEYVERLSSRGPGGGGGAVV
jgi:hypothetical protein